MTWNQLKPCSKPTKRAESKYIGQIPCQKTHPATFWVRPVTSPMSELEVELGSSTCCLQQTSAQHYPAGYESRLEGEIASTRSRGKHEADLLNWNQKQYNVILQLNCTRDSDWKTWREWRRRTDSKPVNQLQTQVLHILSGCSRKSERGTWNIKGWSYIGFGAHICGNTWMKNITYLVEIEGNWGEGRRGQGRLQTAVWVCSEYLSVQVTEKLRKVDEIRTSLLSYSGGRKKRMVGRNLLWAWYLCPDFRVAIGGV